MFVLLHHTKKPEHHKIDVKLKILLPNCKTDITCNTESKKKISSYHNYPSRKKTRQLHFDWLTYLLGISSYIMSTERAAFYADKDR